MARFRRRGSISARDVCLGVVFVACVFAFWRSQKWPGVSALWLPVAGSLAFLLEDVGERLRRRGERDAWVLVGLGLVLGVAWTVYAALGETMVAVARGVIGSGLVLMGATFFSGRDEWRPERGLIPTSLALLIVAGLDPFARTTIPMAVGALGLIAYLALDSPTRRPSGAPARSRLPALAIFLGVAAGIAVGISLLLPWAQPFVEAGVAQAVPTSGQATVELSTTSRLGGFEQLSLSREIVMRVWAPQPLHLRAAVLTDFDGRNWTAPKRPARPLARASGALPRALAVWLADLPGRDWQIRGEVPADAKRVKIIPAAGTLGRLVAPQGPRLLRLGGGTPHVDAAGVLSAAFWPPPEIYAIVHGSPEATSLSVEERAACLQRPEDLDPRLEALATRLASEGRSDRERAQRTLGWIGNECRYTLEAGRFQTDQPVAEFLFEKKRGYCEYFASAAALLLRLQGIPTRYVTGFNLTDESFSAGHFVVRASHAHAWIEAHLPGEGWVELDPTPPGQYRAAHSRGGWGWPGEALEWLRSRFAELSVRLKSGEWRGTLSWLWLEAKGLTRGLLGKAPVLGVLAVLAALVVVARRRRGGVKARRRARATGLAGGASRELVELLAVLDKAWSRRGHPRPATRAPLEHLQGLPGAALPEGLRRASLEGVERLYRARFGGDEATAEELREMSRRIEDAR